MSGTSVVRSRSKWSGDSLSPGRRRLASMCPACYGLAARILEHSSGCSWIAAADREILSRTGGRCNFAKFDRGLSLISGFGVAIHFVYWEIRQLGRSAPRGGDRRGNPSVPAPMPDDDASRILSLNASNRRPSFSCSQCSQSSWTRRTAVPQYLIIRRKLCAVDVDSETDTTGMCTSTHRLRSPQTAANHQSGVSPAVLRRQGFLSRFGRASSLLEVAHG